MRVLILVAITTLMICVSSQDANSQSRKESSTQNLVIPTVELRTEVMDTKYCNDSILSLALNLVYKNKGSNNVILDKYITAVRAYRVFTNEKKLKAGKYEQQALTEYARLFKDPPTTENFLDENFVILKPGEEYILPFERNISADLEDGTEDCNDKDDRCLKPGKYLLQVEVTNWFFSRDVEDALKIRLNDRGDLLTGRILSVPMKFEVKPLNQRISVNCN